MPKYFVLYSRVKVEPYHWLGASFHFVFRISEKFCKFLFLKQNGTGRARPLGALSPRFLSFDTVAARYLRKAQRYGHWAYLYVLLQPAKSVTFRLVLRPIPVMAGQRIGKQRIFFFGTTTNIMDNQRTFAITAALVADNHNMGQIAG